MSKKKVLHILKSSEYSGAEKIAITIIKIMSCDYDMIYLATEGSIKEKLEEEEIEYILLKEYSRKEIKKVIEKVQPHIVHAHDFTASVVSASLKKNFILIAHLHNDPLWVRKWTPKSILFTFLMYKIDKILVVSNSAYNNFVFKEWCRKKTKILFNPIDKQELYQLVEGKDTKKKYDLIFCGRMEEQKNPERFIEIVEKLVREGFDVQSIMLGRGALLESCKQIIKEKQLEKNIHVLGFVSNPYQYMIQSKILCMTSRWEGFGLVAAEANILGIPVLITEAVGLLEVYGKDSYEYCDTNSDFCEKIKELLQDSKQYERIKKFSIEKIKRITDLDLYKKEISTIYEEER